MSSAIKNDLVFSKEDLIGYQVKMMQNQEKAAGYALSVIEESDKASIQYLFNRRKLLKDHLEGERLDGRSYIDILKDLVEQIMNGKGYLLDEDRWMLDFDCVHYDGSAYMMYLPVRGAERDMGKAWKDFIDRCLPYLDRDDPKALQLNQRLYLFLEEKVFDMDAFYRMVLELNRSMSLTGQRNV